MRAAAVRILRNNLNLFDDAINLLTHAARDIQGRVRLEAIVAASWLDTTQALAVVEAAENYPADNWIHAALQQTKQNLSGEIDLTMARSDADNPPEHLTAEAQQQWQRGAEIYRKDGSCGTCHQTDGQGLPAAMFPPLAGAHWVTGNPERLIDITLHGLTGPIEVNGTTYLGHAPMPPFKATLNDDQIAAALTYVRNAFGNTASPVNATQVKSVRQSSNDTKRFWTVQKLEEKYSAE